jgi:hypothetical protein
MHKQVETTMLAVTEPGVPGLIRAPRLDEAGQLVERHVPAQVVVGRGQAGWEAFVGLGIGDEPLEEGFEGVGLGGRLAGGRRGVVGEGEVQRVPVTDSP